VCSVQTVITTLHHLAVCMSQDVCHTSPKTHSLNPAKSKAVHIQQPFTVISKWNTQVSVNKTASRKLNWSKRCNEALQRFKVHKELLNLPQPHSNTPSPIPCQPGSVDTHSWVFHPFMVSQCIHLYWSGLNRRQLSTCRSLEECYQTWSPKSYILTMTMMITTTNHHAS